jgi:hypothetical protein
MHASIIPKNYPIIPPNPLDKGASGKEKEGENGRDWTERKVQTKGRVVERLEKKRLNGMGESGLIHVHYKLLDPPLVRMSTM